MKIRRLKHKAGFKFIMTMALDPKKICDEWARWRDGGSELRAWRIREGPEGNPLPGLVFEARIVWRLRR